MKWIRKSAILYYRIQVKTKTQTYCTIILQSIIIPEVSFTHSINRIKRIAIKSVQFQHCGFNRILSISTDTNSIIMILFPFTVFFVFIRNLIIKISRCIFKKYIYIVVILSIMWEIHNWLIFCANSYICVYHIDVSHCWKKNEISYTVFRRFF